jgi:hypothetical protein
MESSNSSMKSPFSKPSTTPNKHTIYPPTSLEQHTLASKRIEKYLRDTTIYQVLPHHASAGSGPETRVGNVKRAFADFDAKMNDGGRKSL